MKSTFLLSALITAFIFTGCSSVYKTGQTPDDLYYSPAKELPKEEVTTGSNNNARYDEYVSSSDDRYLRMKVANHYRWNAIDDYTYWNDSRYDYYGSGFYNNWNLYSNNHWGGFNNYGYNPYSLYNNWGWGFNSFYPSYYGGNFGSYYGYNGGYYNPWYTVRYYKNPVSRGSTFGSNISSFNNRNYNNTNSNPSNRTSNNNSLGNLIRRTVTPPANSAPNTPSTTVERPSRTYSPSTTPNSNTGGSSGGYKSSGSSSTAPRKPRG